MSVVFITNEAPPRPGGAGVIGDRVVNFHGHYRICPDFINAQAFSKGLKFTRYFWIFELLCRCIYSRNIISSSNKVLLNDFGAALVYYLARPLFGNIEVIYIFHGLLEESNSRFISLKKSILLRVLKGRCIKTLYVSKSIRRIAMSFGYPSGDYGHFGFYLQRPVLRTEMLCARRRVELRFFVAGRINQRKFPVEALNFLVAVAKQSGCPVLVRMAGAWSEHIDKIQACGAKFKGYLDIEYLGYLNNDKIGAEMLGCDFVFNPSTYIEAAPTVAYEAALVGAGYVYLEGDSHVELGVYNSAPCIGIVDFSSQEAARFVKLLSKRNHSLICFSKTMQPVGVLL